MEPIQKLGKYEIRNELGRGSMGVVYEGFDPQIERTVAIKTILKSSVEKQELAETFNRFRREARAAGRLSHPKIVSIYEYGEDEEMAFIVMELIHGKELKDAFDQGNKFSIHDGIRIVMQILDALDYSHSRGVVHRDIKPANILITEQGNIKIADFGIAKIDATNLTQAGVVLGTPTYMSPEQFMGLEVDQRSDLYATGVILYQILTGERPFNGSVITIMHQAVNQEAKTPSLLNPDVSPALDAVVKKAMAKKPETRYQNATEFMQALKEAVQPSSASRTPSDENTLTLAAMPVPIIDAADLVRKADIQAWKKIAESSQLSDFIEYLEKYPAGEFIELAKLRIAALQKLLDQERTANAELQRLQQGQIKAAQEAKNRQIAAQEQAARRQQEEQEKTRLQRQLATLKEQAAKARAEEEIKLAQETAAQTQRAAAVVASLEQRGQLLNKALSERSLNKQAERNFKQDLGNDLAAEVARQKKAERLLRKEQAESAHDAEIEQLTQAQLAEREASQQALAAANAHAELAERRRREAELMVATEKQRTQRFILIGVAGVIALAAAWFFLRSA